MKKLIVPFLLLSFISGASSAFMFFSSHFDVKWLGAFLATFPLPFFLLVLSSVLSIARTSQRLPIIQILSVLGIGISIYDMLSGADSDRTYQIVAVMMASYGVVFVQWYVWVFSRYQRTNSRHLVKGNRIPEFELRDMKGKTVTSTSLKGNKTLLVFFRANWCPFCMNQLKEVLKYADELKTLGVNVKFVSNQGASHSKKLAAKLNMPAHFEVLQDDDLAAAKTLGIEDMGGAPAGMPGYPSDTVMATVVALDNNTKVIFGDETDNYRVRPHPDTFISVFR